MNSLFYSVVFTCFSIILRGISTKNMGHCFAANRGNSEIKKGHFSQKSYITVNVFNKWEEIVLSV